MIKIQYIMSYERIYLSHKVKSIICYFLIIYGCIEIRFVKDIAKGHEMNFEMICEMYSHL